MGQRNFDLKILERSINGVLCKLNEEKIFIPLEKLLSYERFKLFILEKLSFLCYIEEPSEENFARLINELLSEAKYKSNLDYLDQINQILSEAETGSIFDILDGKGAIRLENRILFTFDYLKERLKGLGTFLSEFQLSRILHLDLKAKKKRLQINLSKKSFTKVIWEVSAHSMRNESRN